MYAKLIRRHFLDRPDWQIIGDNVPLGKIYKAIITPIIPIRMMTITNRITKESRVIECVLVEDNIDIGWLPIDALEILDKPISEN